jgi:Icc-related predicted phosphoesterase
MADKNIVRVAAVGDLHYTKNSQGLVQTLFGSIAQDADILILCGDLTDYGTIEEAELLAKELAATVKIPMVGVLGNHDFESGQPNEVKEIFVQSGINMLDGESCEILGIGFAGIKGFIGGFGKYSLGAWGEEGIKAVVKEALDQSLKLESALARLRSIHQIAVLHYSPIAATVEGEPLEIFPFLGSSRLEEPLLRHPVSMVFHGHAHKGTPEGKLLSGKPVYNVPLPLLRAQSPEGTAYKVVHLSIAERAEAALR